MQRPVLPPELSEAIASVATERSLSVASDTHYDAGNIEIRWWSNDVLYRLDFQPMSEGHVLVTALTDTYPFSGRILRLIWQVIPFFPNAAKTKHRVVGELEPPFLPGKLRATIKTMLHNNSFESFASLTGAGRLQRPASQLKRYV